MESMRAQELFIKADESGDNKLNFMEVWNFLEIECLPLLEGVSENLPPNAGNIFAMEIIKDDYLNPDINKDNFLDFNGMRYVLNKFILLLIIISLSNKSVGL